MTEPPDAEGLFARYRRTRNPACLGEVFDLCADDLFAVALHVARDRAAAEDLVQATFLVAMERAERWDAARPLRPWLLGILQHEARRARRGARRVPDAQRVRAVAEPTPPARAFAAETMRAVTAAIPAVPQPYRDVVALHLEHALAPGAIAERLQRSPGAVRTQLWRGLALLRGLLPPGLAVGVAGELAAAMPLAAVRAHVVAAATARAAGVASGVSVGVAAGIGAMSMKKAMLAAAVVVGGAGLWWWSASPGDGQVALLAAANDVAAAPAIATDERAVADVRVDATSRTDAAPSAPADAAPAKADVAQPQEQPFAPVLLPILVVQIDGTPVPAAQVAAYELTWRERDGKREATDTRASEVPREQTTTDANGRATLVVHGPCLIAASKAGVGMSGDVQLLPDQRRLPAPLSIVLTGTATLHGRLVHLGSAVAGAVVHATHGNTHNLSIHEGEQYAHRVRTSADADGRFELTVLAGVGHTVAATHSGESTPLQQVGPLAAGSRHQVVLRFPGAFRVTGRVVDQNGQPIAAAVRFWTKPSEARLLLGIEKAECDAAGRFERLLVQPGTLHVVAGVRGATCAHATVELDDANPHHDLVLRVRPSATVAGKVVDERGAPLADLRLWIRDALPPESGFLGRLRDGVGARPIGEPRTDADGRFRFEVSADCSYLLSVLPLAGHDLRVDSPEFAAPIDDLTVVIRDVDRQGLVITGTVLGVDGELLAGCHVGVREYHGSSSSSKKSTVCPDGRFRRGPLQSGRQFGIEVKAKGYATQVVGPFLASVREEQVTARMQRCGTVRVRVVRADGTPAVGAFSRLQRRPKPDPFGRAWQGETDRDGVITFTDVEPGDYDVWAKPTRAANDNADATTVVATVQPERVTEVRVVLRN